MTEEQLINMIQDDMIIYTYDVKILPDIEVKKIIDYTILTFNQYKRFQIMKEEDMFDNISFINFAIGRAQQRAGTAIGRLGFSFPGGFTIDHNELIRNGNALMNDAMMKEKLKARLDNLNDLLS